VVIRLFVVAVGGAFGAVARYLVSGWVAHMARGSSFPWGTLVVNVAGSLLLGLVMGATTTGRLMVAPELRLLVAVGVLGAFTTFSTLSYETLEAIRVGAVGVAFANLAFSLVVGLGACWIGLRLGGRL
jgi:CrcB protein